LFEKNNKNTRQEKYYEIWKTKPHALKKELKGIGMYHENELLQTNYKPF